MSCRGWDSAGRSRSPRWRAACARPACGRPGLRGTGVTRRATMLDNGEDVTDADPDDCTVAPAGRWIVDPDGAVVRAGLVRHYAARHGLWQLDPDIAYLSGDRLPENVRGFEVLEELTYSERRLRQALSARDVGAVEILVRGVDVDPDVLRARLRLRGSQRLSVVIARIGSGAASRATAFICRAVALRATYPAVMRRCRSRCRLSRTSDDAHSQGGCDSRGRCTGLLDWHIDALRRSRPAPTWAARLDPTASARSIPPTPPTRWTSASPTTIPTSRR